MKITFRLAAMGQDVDVVAAMVDAQNTMSRAAEDFDIGGVDIVRVSGSDDGTYVFEVHAHGAKRDDAQAIADRMHDELRASPGLRVLDWRITTASGSDVTAGARARGRT